MVSPHDISDKFPETADIETVSDDYGRRFAGVIGVLDLLQDHPGVTIPAYALRIYSVGYKCSRTSIVGII